MNICILLIIIITLTALYIFSIFPRLAKREEMAAFNHTLFAHRGYHCAEKLIPENSMPAFKAAVSHNYGIELDVHLTRDKKLVVFHDDTLERMCRVQGTVESYTYEELLKFHLLNTAEKIPLFSQVLEYVNGRVPLLIELKIPGQSHEICQAVQQALSIYKGPFLVQSFNTMGILWFRHNAPHILRGQLSSNLTADAAGETYILRFFVKHLLSNFLGRPDFISYKLKDLPVLGVTICQRLFRTPIAVWTLRTPKALEEGISAYNIQIFEKTGENY